MHLPQPDPAFRWSIEAWGDALVCAPLQGLAQHAFTTKQLQLLPSALNPQQPAWIRAAESLAAVPAQVMRVKQVHGRSVRILRHGDAHPRDGEARPEADGLVANARGLVLAVQVADCVPLLMADRRTGAAAAVHAGWRGTCAGIASAAVETMAREFGTAPADLVAAIGPSIGACCYQVGEELLDAFRGTSATADQLRRWFSRPQDGSLRLDLWTANRDQLIDAGVSAGNVHVARLCTQTHSHIFESYRAEGAAAGRMAALIRVPEALNS